MRLFWQEMRKIWRPSILAVLVALSVLFYFLRPKLWIEFIPETPYFDESIQLVERYGPLLTAEIRPELDSLYEEIKENFNREIQKIPEVAEAGITDVESYQAADRSSELYKLKETLNKTAKSRDRLKARQNNPSSRQILPRIAGFFTE